MRWCRGRCSGLGRRGRAGRADRRRRTGTIAGERSDWGKSLPIAVHRVSSGVRGAKVKIEALAGALAPARRGIDDIVGFDNGSASPSRRHDRSVPSRGSSMSPDAPVDAAVQLGGRAFDGRSSTRLRRHSIADDFGAAARRFDRQRAGAAAGIEHARGRSGRRAATTAAWRASRRARRARWRGSSLTGASEVRSPTPRRRCGRNKFQPRGSHASRPGRNGDWVRLVAARVEACASLIRTPGSRRCRGPSSAALRAGRLPAHSVAARRRYSLRTASISGVVLHFEQRALLQARAADRIEIGEVREALRARWRRRSGRSRRCAAERLAMTPARRTS